MGSISLTPPSGPYVPSGTTLNQLNADITTTGNDYTAAINSLNSATQAYNSKKAEIDAFLTAHGISDWTSWSSLGDQEDALLSQYRSLVASLVTLKTAEDTASTNFVSKATAYVDALARRQIYADTSDQTTVKNNLLSILNLPVPTQEISGMPAFPSLTSAQRTSINQSITALTTSTDNTAANNLLDAFTNLRHNEYMIALSTSQLLSLQGTADITWYHYLDPNDPTLMSNVNAARAAVTSKTTTLNSYVSQRAGFSSALSTAVSAYETAYTSVRSPLSSAITAFRNYANSWQSTLTALYNQTTQALQATATAFQTADTQAKSDHLASVQMSTLTEESMAAELEAFSTQMAVLQQMEIGTPEIPALPLASSHLSLSDLMRTISQVQLTTMELVRSIQQTEHDINSTRLQMALANLTLYAEEMAKFTSWAQQVYSEDFTYNANVNSENRRLYNDFSKTYNAWFDILRNHVNLINAAIDDVNAQITIANQNAASLVTLTNGLQPSIVDAINQERTSVPQSGNYLNFLQGTAVAPRGSYSNFTSIPAIPLLSHVSGTELPELPLSPPLPDNAQLPDDFSTQVTAINTAIANVLPLFTAIRSVIATELAAAHPPIALPGSLEQLLLYSVIPVRNYQEALLAFQQPTVLLMGYLEQYLTTSASSIARADEMKIVLKMLQSTLTELQMSQTSSVSGSQLSAISANLFAQESLISRALTLMTSSEAFAQMMLDAMERAASLAGLTTASILGILTSGIPSGSTATNTLLVNMMVQLVLSVADSNSLRQNALTILQTNPELATLKPEEIQQLVSALVLIQQNMLLFAAISSGIQAGMTPGQLIALLLPRATLTGIGTVSQFLGMGFLQAAAVSLSAFALDNAPLIAILARSGMPQKAILEIVSLLAASKGIVSLTSGVPGGSAFLDIIISDLKQAGINITVPLSNITEFINELETNLEPRIREEDLTAFKQILLETPPPIPLGDRTAQAFQNLAATFQQLFTQSALEEISAGAPEFAPSEAFPFVETQLPFASSTFPEFERLQQEFTALFAPEIPTDTTQSIFVNPSNIMQRFVDEFRTLPPEIQQSALASVPTFMPEVTAMTNEQKASLAIAVRIGLVSLTDATNLMALYILQTQSQLTSLESIETAIAHQLFVPTEEERERIREELNQFTEHIETTQFDTQILNSFSKETLDQVKIAMSSFFGDLAFTAVALRSYMAFAQTVQRLSNFNTIFANFIINPGKSILKEFSLLTSTTQRIPVILSG